MPRRARRARARAASWAGLLASTRFNTLAMATGSMGVKISGGGAAGASIASSVEAPAWQSEGLKKFKELQTQMGGLIEKQTTFDAQRNENMLVKQVRRRIPDSA